MNDLRKAAEMALEALEALWDILDDIDTASDMAKENDAWYRKRVEALQKKRWDTMITTDGYKLRGGPVEALHQALAQSVDLAKVGEVGVWGDTPPCKTDPRAPHGFDRNASHNADRYVCECESWEPPKRDSSSWVGLTDEEIYDYADKFLYQHGSNFGIKSFGKALEAKLKEKNT